MQTVPNIPPLPRGAGVHPLRPQGQQSHPAQQQKQTLIWKEVSSTHQAPNLLRAGDLYDCTQEQVKVLTDPHSMCHPHKFGFKETLF